MSDPNDSGCGGCLVLIVTVLFFWALLFGVTLDGHHYGVSGCSCDKGLEIDR